MNRWFMQETFIITTVNFYLNDTELRNVNTLINGWRSDMTKRKQVQMFFKDGPYSMHLNFPGN